MSFDVDYRATNPLNVIRKRRLRKGRIAIPGVLPTLKIFLVIALVGTLESIESKESSKGKKKSDENTIILETVAPSPIFSSSILDIISSLEDELRSETLSSAPTHAPLIAPSPVDSEDLRNQNIEPTLTIEDKLEEALHIAKASMKPSITPTIMSTSSPSFAPEILSSNFPTSLSTNNPSLTTSTIPTLTESNSSSALLNSSSLAPTTLISMTPSEAPITFSPSQYPKRFPFMIPTTTFPSFESTIHPTSELSQKPTSNPTQMQVITRITCPPLNENDETIAIKHQISYTYSIETRADIDKARVQNIISFIEQTLLLNLSVDFLPCDFLKNSESNIVNNSGRGLTRVLPPRVDESSGSDEKVVLMAIDSHPPDELSARRCSPTIASSNVCQFIEGFLTITLDGSLDISYVESVMFIKINGFMVSLADNSNVPGLLSASFYDPFSEEALGILDTSDGILSNGLLAKQQQLREMLSYTAIILLCFTLAAVTICGLQYRSSSLSAKNLANREHSDQTPPSTPPSPEDLDAIPTRSQRSFRALHSKKDISKRLVRIWESNDNNGEENLSVIMEGSNEDGASSCVSSAFGNFSILTPSVTDSERDMELLDLALSPHEEEDLRKENYSDDQIKDLRNFRAQLVKSTSGKKGRSPSLSSLEEEPPLMSPSSPTTKSSPTRLQDRISFNRSLPLSLHRMSEASKKNLGIRKNSGPTLV